MVWSYIEVDEFTKKAEWGDYEIVNNADGSMIMKISLCSLANVRRIVWDHNETVEG